jgi:hypothetical protein
MNDEQKHVKSVPVHEEILAEAIGGTVREIVKFVSSAVTIVFLAAIIGWVRAHYYYAEFGLHWIANELTTVHLMSMSVMPLTITLLSFLTVFFFVSDGKYGIATMEKINKIFFGVFAALASVKFLLLHFGHSNYVSALENISAVVSPIMYAVIFALLAATLRLTKYQWNFALIVLAGVSIYGMLWSVPQQMGTMQGKIESQVWKSNLPSVRIEGASNNWHLLLMRNDVMYLVSRNEDEMKMHLKVLPATVVSEVTTSLGIDLHQ